LKNPQIKNKRWKNDLQYTSHGDLSTIVLVVHKPEERQFADNNSTMIREELRSSEVPMRNFRAISWSGQIHRIHQWNRERIAHNGNTDAE